MKTNLQARTVTYITRESVQPTGKSSSLLKSFAPQLFDYAHRKESTMPIERLRVPNLDAVLGVEFPVLDSGFVRVIDYMGGDPAIVQAARVSYGAGTKRVLEDAGLIKYLLRHQHTTPFEMAEIKLHVRVPMDCWRQWIRHRTANVNEYSTRYSVAIDAAQLTPETAWRRQTALGKQGSEGFVEGPVGTRLTAREAQLQSLAREVYKERIDAGVAREQARKDLPLSTYTEAYWKIDLHNLLHFLRLRMDLHAQTEIREYASVIGREVVERWCPIAWAAFEDYQLKAVVFSSFEQQILTMIHARDTDGTLDLAVSRGWLSANRQLVRNRERQEFEHKLTRIGLPVPWRSSSE